MKRNTTAAAATLAMLAMLLTVGCQTAPKSEADRADLVNDAQAALSRMQAEDETLDEAIDEGYGYVIFPNAGKGGLIVGGGYGRGVVYEQDRQIGYADITQLSAGAQVGGQAFSELIVFENEAALDRFKNNQLTFGANASAVAIKKGAAAATEFQDGVKVFVMPKAGLMAEFGVAGQKFTFTPLRDDETPASTRPAARSASAKEGEAEVETRTTETEKGEAEVETRTTETETRTETETEQRRRAD